MAARMLRDLLSVGVDVAAIQKENTVCEVDARVQFSDFIVYSGKGCLEVLMVNGPLSAWMNRSVCRIFRRLGPSLMESLRLVFMGDRNAILDTSLERVAGC